MLIRYSFLYVQLGLLTLLQMSSVIGKWNKKRLLGSPFYAFKKLILKLWQSGRLNF